MFEKNKRTVQSKERRKTGHIVDGFRSYVTREISRVVGLELDDRQAWTIFKLAHRLPMRYLITIKPEDYDLRDEPALTVPGIGRFKFMNTVPQGRRIELVGKDGSYPRYKFYPASCMESEVEILHGLENPEARADFERIKDNEDRNITQNIKDMAKQVKKLTGNPQALGGYADVTADNIGDIIKKLIASEVEKEISKLKSSGDLKENERDEDEGENETYDESEDEKERSGLVDDENTPEEDVVNDVQPQKIVIINESVDTKTEEPTIQKPINEGFGFDFELANDNEILPGYEDTTVNKPIMSSVGVPEGDFEIPDSPEDTNIKSMEADFKDDFDMDINNFPFDNKS